MSDMYSALLIDDEEASLEMLEILLKKNCPQISEIHLANNAKEASVIILRKKPDIIFTDIKMPGLSGIDLLNSFSEKTFKSIIVTAFPDFGIEAVKAGANDYLIKPIISHELIDAVQKIALLISKERTAITPTKAEPITEHKYSEKLLIKDLHGTILINYDDVVFFEAVNNYTNIHCINGHKYVSPKTLKFHEDATNHPSFYRVHKSFLINVDYVDKYVAGNDRSLYLKGGHLVKVAVNKRGDFRRFLQRKL